MFCRGHGRAPLGSLCVSEMARRCWLPFVCWLALFSASAAQSNGDADRLILLLNGRSGPECRTDNFCRLGLGSGSRPSVEFRFSSPGLVLGNWLSFSLRLTKEGGNQRQRGSKEPRIFSNRFCRHQLVRPGHRPSAGATSGERRAVAFVSRSLTTAEERYSKIEKEALGVLWAIQRFIKLHNLSSFVETDHQPLVRLLGSTDLDLTPRHVKWFHIRLLRYRFMVQYGKCLATANMSSRDPKPPLQLRLLRTASSYLCRRL
ncbi:uncharacterized protein ISCGN_002929 [Ixodes scapularis]